MKFKIYKNTITDVVEQIVTVPLYIEHTDVGYEWQEHDTESVMLNELEVEMLVDSLKYAVPNKCYFRNGIFKPLEEFENIFEDEEKYADLVKDKWIEVRILRNSFLSESDWTQTLDAPISSEKQSEWAAYRNILRDLPENTASPYLVDWPTKPE